MSFKCGGPCGKTQPAGTRPKVVPTALRSVNYTIRRGSQVLSQTTGFEIAGSVKVCGGCKDKLRTVAMNVSEPKSVTQVLPELKLTR